jgi:hypothetical protein
MTWSDFYLTCFLVGFALSVLSFLAGAVHLHVPFKLHLPFHWHHSGLRFGLKGGTHLSWFNASSLMAFLAWFGGTGYLLTRHSGLLGVLILAISVFTGGAASWVIFRFMVKLMGQDEPIKAEDGRVEGSIATVSMPIRQNGTGEIIFSLNGVRRCSGARVDGAGALEKGAEVVIERYDKGIAYVKRWEEFSK